MIQTPDLLFVENPRTASTVISQMLMDYCDVTPIVPRHGSLRDNVFDGGDPTELALKTVVVVRNPIDRMVSLWQMDHNDLSFREWMKRGLPEWQFVPQSYYAEGVSLVLKYENLKEEWDDLMKQTGYNLTLPEHEPKVHPSITQADKDLVYKMYQEDFETFGYKNPSKAKPKAKTVRPIESETPTD